MKKMAILLRAVFSLLLLVSLVCVSACSTGNASDSSASDESWKTIQQKGTLVIGLEDDFLPVSDFDGDTVRGFAAESALEVCRRLNVEVEFVAVTASGAKEALDAGEIDCVWAANKKSLLPEESSALSYTYFHGHQAILCLASSEIRNIADLQGQTLGVKDGSSGQKELEASTTFKDSLAGVSSYPDTASLKAALDEQEVFAIVLEDFVAEYYCRESPEMYSMLSDDTGNAPMSLTQDDYCTIFRSGDASLAAQVESILDQMISDGTLAVYSSKWFGKDLITAH